ncbi:MAG: hypothetical protein GAK28_04374 [Luteibacter sp.]|uniref:hypothetical protein n=1 Tax=Luteibacter sp. TaxID=1886636 RepID=UPI0013862CF1|nr:hypothetical protein [Luteibacter sp.]KAF1003911.1 MAG: hypothetical protein GAK28_04374 [Luteibacter sp.]
MRAKWAALLAVLPLAAAAGPMEPAFDTLASNLLALMGTMLPIMAVIGILLVGIKVFTGGDDLADALIKLGVPLFVVIGGFAVMRTFLGAMGVQAPDGPKDSGPGFFAMAWSWLIGHLLPLGLTIGAVGGVSWFAVRSLRKRRDSRQVKLDVRAVIETVERADALRLYWEFIALPQANAGDGMFRPNYVQDALSTIKRMQSELMPMLERAHGGTPLDRDQRKRLEFIRQEFNRYMKTPTGKTLDIAAELSQLAATPVNATQGQAPSVRAPEWRQATAGVAAAAPVSPVQTATAGPLDLLNPFNLTNLVNPLSPLSPLSPWSAWRSGERHHDAPSPSPSDSSEWVGRRFSSEPASSLFDASSSAGGADTYEPARSFECSRSDAGPSYDSSPSWSSSDSSSSCDSGSSSSDSSSSSSD